MSPQQVKQNKAGKERARSPRDQAKDAIVRSCGQHARTRRFNMWLVYSGRCEKTQLLSSDAEFVHFLACEFDPAIHRIEYKPAPIQVTVDGKRQSVEFDAIVVLRNGTIECRKLVARLDSSESEAPVRLQRVGVGEAAAQTRGGIYRELSARDLMTRKFRIQNSLRMLRFIAAAQGYELRPLINAVVMRVRNVRTLTLASLLDAFPPAQAALVLAAAFVLVQRGQASIDIDSRYVTLDTVIERPE